MRRLWFRGDCRRRGQDCRWRGLQTRCVHPATSPAFPLPWGSRGGWRSCTTPPTPLCKWRKRSLAQHSSPPLQRQCCQGLWVPTMTRVGYHKFDPGNHLRSSRSPPRRPRNRVGQGARKVPRQFPLIFRISNQSHLSVVPCRTRASRSVQSTRMATPYAFFRAA